MVLLKYTGSSHYRELLPRDFDKVGVEVEQPVVFARHEVTTVSREVAEAIYALTDGEFEAVSDGDEAPE